jgi:hypothetical protein
VDFILIRRIFFDNQQVQRRSMFNQVAQRLCVVTLLKKRESGGEAMSNKIDVPDGLEEVGESMKALLAELATGMKMAKIGRTPDYRDMELRIATSAAEIERQSHRALLQALDVDASRVKIDGNFYRRVLREDATYHTMAGDVVVTRSLYRECGTHHGRTVDAVSLRAGVVGDGWLPLTAKAMAHLLSQGTSREAEITARRMNRLEYSRSSFERVGHLMGEMYVKRHPEIEDELMRGLAIPEEARSVSISIDRVSVPMEEPRKRPVGRPRKDAPKKPVERNFRMAWCGTVTLHDKEGEALHTIRYGRMPQGDPVELVESLIGDVLVMREKRRDLAVAALADGAHENWDLLGRAADEHLDDIEVRQLVDLWHVLEKLGAAARVMYGDAGAKEGLARWRMMLLNNKSAAALILDELKSSGREKVKVGDKRPVHEAVTYLTNHKGRMDYASARRAGLPVGSGAVEATCKSLFELRMKRPGSRWKEHTGAHIVHLRALALSDRWDQALHFILSPLIHSVRAVA